MNIIIGRYSLLNSWVVHYPGGEAGGDPAWNQNWVRLSDATSTASTSGDCGDKEKIVAAIVELVYRAPTALDLGFIHN